MIDVQATLEDGVLSLVMCDEARKNAMSPELGEAFRARVQSFVGHPELRAVVVSGAANVFSAGGDLGMLERLRAETEEASKAFMLDFYSRFLCILDLNVPVVAAVVGPAIGAGFALALACHTMVVAEDATLALNFVELGLYPGMGSTYFAPRRLGAARAADWLMSGRRIKGAEAHSAGASLACLPRADVVPEALRVARSYAKNGPLAVGALARTLGADREALAAALDRESTEQAKSYRSRDLAEGLAAIREKRIPRF